MDERWKKIFTLLKDPTVSEVEANGPNEFFIKQSGERKPINIKFGTVEEYYKGIENSLVPNMQSILKWDRNGYLFEGPLIIKVGGTRIQARCHIVLPPATLYPQITIAKKSTSLISLDDITDSGSMAPEMKMFLKMAVENRLNIVISGGTGAGKALTLDTKIPTPQGFTSMGEINVGDEIFDRFGNIGVVQEKFYQPLKKVYEVELETGEVMECDAEHNWMYTSDGVVYQVKTTEELFNLDDRVLLPILPAKTELEIVEEYHKLGEEIAKDKASWPETLITLSDNERFSILSGVLDTVGDLFYGEFRLLYLNEEFDRKVLETASSLGYKVYFDDEIRIISPVALSKYIEIIEDFNLFWRENDWPKEFAENRLVVRIEETDKEKEMACISVNTVDKTYLITESFIPTHNTTMLEAFTRYIDKDARVGIAEDAPELNLPEQPNTTFLHSVPWQPGLDPNNVATLDWVVQQFQRMRTDILLVGEVRGKEFASFLIAANSGMDGSMTTIHANDAKKALNKMTNFALTGAQKQPIRSINTDIANSIDIIVQLGILYDGSYRVLEITEVTNTLSNDDQATISTEQLYKYDISNDTFIKQGTMTDSLRQKLESRGANIAPFLSQQIGTVLQNTPTGKKIGNRPFGKGRRMGLPRS